jgi:hypothetical protein
MSFKDAIVPPYPPPPSMNPFNAAEEEQSDSPRSLFKNYEFHCFFPQKRQQIKREMRELEANKRLPFPIPPAGMDEFKRRSFMEEEERRKMYVKGRGN